MHGGVSPGAASAGLAFRYFAPGRELAGRVAFHYVIEAGASAIAEPVCALLGQIQFGLAGTAGYAIDGGVRVLPDAAVVAPIDRAATFHATAGYRAVWCGLTPAGWAALIDAPTGGLPGGLGDARPLLEGAPPSSPRSALCPAPKPGSPRSTLLLPPGFTRRARSNRGSRPSTTGSSPEPPATPRRWRRRSACLGARSNG
jgi:hypothetical protein